MSKTAWLYILGVLATGLGLTVLTLPSLVQPQAVWASWLILTILATLALLFSAVFTTKQEPDSGTTAYSPVLVLMLAAALLLPAGPLALLVIVSHLIQWIKERWAKSGNLPVWYIQPFNMAVYIITGDGVRELYDALRGGPEAGFSLLPLLTALLVILAYLGLNTLLIGEALVLARGASWRESGVFARENLLGDLVMLSLGYVLALLWVQSPWLVLLALAPLVLISRALQVPQLKKEAQTDGKTGLINARYFGKLFGMELERARRFNRPLAVFMSDLDFLRNINNTYGHLAGDIVLSGIGRVIRETIREYDIAARFGGEEFAIVLPEAGRGEAVALAERLRKAVAATPFSVATSPTPIHVTISIGIACFPEDSTTATGLVHAADVAVYQAKLAGRDRVVCAAEVPHSAALALMPTSLPVGAEERLVATGAALEDLVAGARPEEVAALSARVQRMRSEQIRAEAGSAPVEPTGAWPADLRAVGVDARPAASSPATAEASAPTGRARFVLALYVAAVLAAGASVALLGFHLQSHLDYAAIGLFMLLGAFFELFTINIYGPATTSVTVTVLFATALLLDIPGVCLVSAAIALMHYLRRRPQFYKMVFNWATYLLAGSAVVAIMHAVGLRPTAENLVWLLLPGAAAALAQYAINTALVTGAISISTGKAFVTTWKQEFQWLAGHYLVLGMLGLLLALAYHLSGAVGTMVFALPLVMIRYAQQQYVERTRNSVQELTRMNEELARANREIVAANGAIQRLNGELFVTVAKILDARDPYVAGHAAQVAAYAMATAQALELPAWRVERIRQAGFLHDIGKMAIAEQVLHKPDRLTADEYESVKAHAVVGAHFLASSQALGHLAPYVRHHHERWDGQGYPDGLRGAEIPLEARILAVCDAVEAMASDRPYQRGKSPREIIAELQRCAGSHFDPAVAQAFISIVEREGENFVINSAREVVRKQGQARESQPAPDDWAVRPVPSWAS